MAAPFDAGEERIILEIIDLCRRLNAKGMLAAADGNLSFRVSDERILITPSGVNKAFMKPEDMALVTLDNRILHGNPSSERLIHLEVYKNCPKARAAVHAHPPAAIAWSLARPYMRELPSDCLPEVMLAVGKIPILPYARPSTSEMAQRLAPHLCRHRALILARHGALAWGESLMEAYNGIERIEHSAWILRLAQGFGGLSSLPAEEIAWLSRARGRLGEKIL